MCVHFTEFKFLILVWESHHFLSSPPSFVSSAFFFLLICPCLSSALLSSAFPSPLHSFLPLCWHLLTATCKSLCWAEWPRQDQGDILPILKLLSSKRNTDTDKAVGWTDFIAVPGSFSSPPPSLWAVLPFPLLMPALRIRCLMANGFPKTGVEVVEISWVHYIVFRKFQILDHSALGASFSLHSDRLPEGFLKRVLAFALFTGISKTSLSAYRVLSTCMLFLILALCPPPTTNS